MAIRVMDVNVKQTHGVETEVEDFIDLGEHGPNVLHCWIIAHRFFAMNYAFVPFGWLSLAHQIVPVKK